MTSFAVSVLVLLQGAAVVVLLRRLMPGRRRLPAVQPAFDTIANAGNSSSEYGAAHASPHERASTSAQPHATVSVILATLNEATRIAPCLAGLAQQSASLLEVLVVDSRSTDGTCALVQRAAERDVRFQLLADDPLPTGWVGKVWALETGLRVAKGEWILGIDADTIPQPGMIDGILHAMHRHGYDAASFAPRFVGQTPAERWLQPAMLVTLIYRTGAAGAETRPDRVLANGQCLMARRSTLIALGGYAVSRDSFSDDVTLARHLARNGARVGFLDGSKIIDVRAYASLHEMWREWGRSFDLKDGSTFARRWFDVAFIWLTMALPVPVLVVLTVMISAAPESFAHVAAANSGAEALVGALLGVNLFLLGMRFVLLRAIRGNYAERGFTFWVSWLADVPAAIRLTMSTARRPRVWRGRTYAADLVG